MWFRTSLKKSARMTDGIYMRRLGVFCKTLWAEEDGQDLVEYSLLLAFIALAAVTILSSVKTSIKTLWNDVSNALTCATTGAS